MRQRVGSNGVASLTAGQALAILARRSIPKHSKFAVAGQGWSRVWSAFSVTRWSNLGVRISGEGSSLPTLMGANVRSVTAADSVFR